MGVVAHDILTSEGGGMVKGDGKGMGIKVGRESWSAVTMTFS